MILKQKHHYVDLINFLQIMKVKKSRGLTEGYTEILSMAGVPGTIEISSGYYIEAILKKFSIIKEKYQMYLNESIKSTSIKM